MRHRTTRQTCRRRGKYLAQKAAGLLLLVFSAVLFLIAANSTTVEGRDCTAVFVLVALGVYLVFTKKQIMIW